MKKSLLLLFCIFGFSIAASAQTKFVVELDNVRREVISQRTYTTSESQSILASASYRGSNCPRTIPVHVFIYDPGTRNYEWSYTSPFVIYCGDTMDTILDRILAEFF